MATRTEEFARKLNELTRDRYGRSPTAERLAEIIRDKTGFDISPGSIRFWQKGERLPTGHNLEALADAFGDELKDIAGGPEYTPKMYVLKTLDENWQDLTPDEREAIERIAKRQRNGSMQVVPSPA